MYIFNNNYTWGFPPIDQILSIQKPEELVISFPYWKLQGTLYLDSNYESQNNDFSTYSLELYDFES